MDKLDVFNEILQQFREPPVTSLTAPKLFEFPWNNIEDLLNEAITNFTNRNSWGWTLTETQLNYQANSNEFNLTDYGIDYNKIETVYYILGTYPVVGFYYLKLLNRQLFKRNYPNFMVEGKPILYSQEDDNLFIYPIPDADYQIIVKHYQKLPCLHVSTDTIPMIPDKYCKTVIYEVSSILATILGKDNVRELNMNHIQLLGESTKMNQTYMQSSSKFDTRLSFRQG